MVANRPRRWVCRAVAPVLVAGLTAACSANHATRSSASNPTTTSPVAVGSTSAAPTTTSPTTTAAATPRPSRASLSVLPTTPVSPPTPGNISQTVPSRAITTMPAVALNSSGSFGDGVGAAVVAIKAVQARGQGPGEVSGPGLQITIQLHNGTTKALPLDNVVVNLTDSTNAPANPMSGAPANPFSGSLAPGGKTTGVYVFTVPVDRRSRIAITINYSGRSAVVVFTGSAP